MQALLSSRPPQGRLQKTASILLCLSTAILIGSVCPGPVGAAASPQEPSALSSSVEERLAQGMRAYDSGRLDDAIRIWEIARKEAESTGSTALAIEALCRISDIHRRLGRLFAARQDAESALRLAEASGRSLPQALATRGAVSLDMGEPDRAVADFKQALALQGSAQGDAFRAAVLNQLALAHGRKGETQTAKKLLAESMALVKTDDPPVTYHRALLNMARMCWEAGETDCASEHLARLSETIQKAADSQEKAFLLVSAGELASRVLFKMEESSEHRGHLEERAFRLLSAGRDLAEKDGDSRLRSYANGYLARLYEHRGREEEALSLTRLAVFDAQRAHAPESLYLWQWQIGRLLAAERRLEESLEAYRRAIFSVERIREDLALDCQRSGRQSFRETIGPIYFQLADLLLQRSAKRREPQAAQSDLREARDTIEKLKAVEIQDYFQDDCITSMKDRITSLEEIAPRTAAVYPILLQERTEILLSTAEGIQQFTAADIGRGRIASEVNRLRRKIQRPGSRLGRQTENLYQWLIQPLEADLQRMRIDTLVWIPDGPLRTVPLAVLNDGRSYLVERFAIVTVPGLTLTDPRPISRQNMEMLVSGLTEPVQGFPPLPNVAYELEKLRDMFPANVLKDETFSKENVRETFASHPAPVVHIASHGQFDSDPSKTFLLTYEDKLSMEDLESLMRLSQYRQEPVELLTLSACQTAVGDDRAALGLAGVALKAGARSAVATLWFVDDEATSRLVTNFYENLKMPSLTKSQALQAAQIRLMSEEKFRHPAFWGPFLLIGNWL